MALASVHFSRPPARGPTATTHCRQQIGPSIERQRGENIAARQMMLERGALASRQRAGLPAMQMPKQVAFPIIRHTVAKNKILHAPADVDWVQLNEAMMSERRSNLGHRRIQQNRSAM